MQIFAYHMPPIDWWIGWKSECEFINDIVKWFGDLTDITSEINNVSEFKAAAEIVAKKLGWEGDCREGPYYSGLPCEGGFNFILAWKQDNNGSTFVFSEVPLSFLQRDAVDYGLWAKNSCGEMRTIYR